MTTKNHSAFLMCPTSRTTHLGGTPLESGEAGGHIRKTWVHVHSAALLGLPEVVANDQALSHGLGDLKSGVRGHELGDRLGRTAQHIATEANRRDFQRLGVITMVVTLSGTRAVNASKFRCGLEGAATDGANHLQISLVSTAAVFFEVFPSGPTGGAARHTSAVGLLGENVTTGHAGLFDGAVNGHGSGLGFGGLGQITLPALDRLKVVNQRLDGLHAGVFTVLICELSRERFSDSCLCGDKLPAAGAGLFQLAFEVVND